MAREFHRLEVAGRRAETDATATLAFELPENLKDAYRWRPGQHITLRLTVDGAQVRRSYSVSASPFSGGPLQITVKRVEGGLVSNHLNDTVAAGDSLDVMTPFGGFCLDPGETARRTHYFFGAGSGITPLYSMLHSVLLVEPHSTAHLIYGNADADTIIFREALDGLAAEHGGRFSVSHVLSKPSMWSWFAPWRTGIVDEAAVGAFLDANPPYAQDTQYYVCGPGGMNGAVRQALMNLDVPPARIHMESYGGADVRDTSVEGVASDATVRVDGHTGTVRIAQGETVLQATRRAGLEPPYSCEAGVCGACRARLTEGSVHMRARMALEDDEIAAGHILTCQAVPTSEKIAVDYNT